jgi:protein-S-isoprenylcysteine O-methyltransferase Ste14
MFSSGLSQTIAMVAAVVLFYLVDFGFILFYAGRRQGHSLSCGYTVLAWVVMGIVCLQPVLWPGLALRLSGWLGVVLEVFGMLLVAGSLGLQIWARLHLQQFYAEGADVQPDHQLIDTGPYAYVRHPLFDSYFLFALGLLCITPALTTLGIGLYTFWDFNRAATADEYLLSKEVEGYREYMVRTPRFLPRLWSRKM